MDKIQFISTIDGLQEIEECKPRPAKHFIPKWFKDISSDNKMSVKQCPSFPDYFSLGYIVPMWCDSSLFYNKDVDHWEWNTSSNIFLWNVHANQQFIDHTSPIFNGVRGNFVFKAECPWRIITPPGWSVLQLPLFYHFNSQWSVLPGVIDTDIHHEINQQVLYHGNEEIVNIIRGEPFVLYVPFKRESVFLEKEIRYQNESDIKKFTIKNMNFKTKFSPNGVYRKLQRFRDKND